MDSLFSRFSLYDILSMVIPGGTILLFLTRYWEFDWFPNEHIADKALTYSIFIVLAYLAGIVSHAFTQEIWKPYRNNPKLIREALKQLKDETGDLQHIKQELLNRTKDEPAWIKPVVYFPFGIMVCSCVFGYLVSLFHQSCNETKCCHVFYVFANLFFLFLFALIFLAGKISTHNNEDDKKLIASYYNAYYFLEEKKKIKNVSVMEGQVAFIQNMQIPLFLLIVLPYEKWNTIIGDSYLFPCRICCIKFVLSLICLLFLLSPITESRKYIILYGVTTNISEE